MKPVTIDGETYRVRRGKLVLIPSEWVGRVYPQPGNYSGDLKYADAHPRPSKFIHKLRKSVKLQCWKSRKGRPLPEPITED